MVKLCTEPFYQLHHFAGDLDQIHYRTDKTYNYIDLDCNLAHDDGNADSSDLNVFVQLGDIIEYRSSKKDAPMKGQIVSIGALSSDRILQVSNGTWLSRKVHQVKRIEIVRPLEDKRLVNPSPKWKGLNKVVVIPPFETVDEDDEVEGVVENDINSGGNTTTADATSPGPAESNASDEPTAGTNQDQEEEEQIPRHTSRSERNKRQRTSCGTTNNSHWVETRKVRHEQDYLDKRRATHTYLPWARDGLEYDRAKLVVNKMYLHTLKFGIVHKFYEKKPFAALAKAEFNKSIKDLRNAVNNRIKTNAVSIEIKFDISFMDNPCYGEHGRSTESNRSRQTIEEMLKFEYKMKTLQLQTCSVCRENRLEFLEKDKESATRCEQVICSTCRTKKHKESDYFLKNNYHPIWYERDSEGVMKFDDDGKPVVRYDIPSELKDLTMSEKLLIRRCSPMIPSMHIKGGIYGINGHCVCFPQDINNMCMELPQTETSMVTFVRHISNRVTGESISRHYKVNKKKVIAALKWLKVHHSGYHGITINESNLDWIKNGSLYDVAKKYTLNTKPSRRDAVADAAETLSGNQTGTNGDKNNEDDFEMETVHPNYNNNLPNSTQAKIVKEFESIAHATNQKEKVLDFPPIDHNAPIK